MLNAVSLIVILLAVFSPAGNASPLSGAAFSSLSKEQQNSLFINSLEQLHACPGDTVRLGIKAMNFHSIPPMAGIPVDIQATWQVWPVSGTAVDQQRALLVVSREVNDGTRFTIRAKISEKGVVKKNTLYIHTRERNPFAGNWREEGGNIGELYIHPDRRFSLTVHPFEVYRDYWGHVTYDLKKKTIAFTIEGGNKQPDDCDLKGTFRFLKDGSLSIRGIYFGTIVREDSFRRSYLFRKAGR
ncbi:MAG: hypothetical protein HGA62_06755 [Chlorobiaceae bacterium]|nr:hypothetical protein [Chlorobiaceae bacterium]NTV60294.1 hypothetical protein [Chlorobiaceae bacterium]